MKYYIKKSELGYFHVYSDDDSGHPNRVRCETYSEARTILKALRKNDEVFYQHWPTTLILRPTATTNTIRYTTIFTPITYTTL